ncbi:unnamed protein product [Pedinophyceae sp. YPF-701]|nr:unnamed protein product [Pedinophyceae sp. YPF-701]
MCEHPHATHRGDRHVPPPQMCRLAGLSPRRGPGASRCHPTQACEATPLDSPPRQRWPVGLRPTQSPPGGAGPARDVAGAAARVDSFGLEEPPGSHTFVVQEAEGVGTAAVACCEADAGDAGGALERTRARGPRSRAMSSHKRHTIEDLPLDLAGSILGGFSVHELSQLALVNRYFRALSEHDTVWSGAGARLLGLSATPLLATHRGAKGEFRRIVRESKVQILGEWPRDPARKGAGANHHGRRQSIRELNGRGICQLALSDNHAAATSIGGNVYFFGIPGDHLGGGGDRGQPEGPAQQGSSDDAAWTLPRLAPELRAVRAAAVVLGARHSLVLSEDGIIFAAGSNRNGELGNGTTEPDATFKPITTVRVLAGDAVSTPGSVTWEEKAAPRFAAVASGPDHCCAIAEGGVLYTWGAHASGALGHVMLEPPPRSASAQPPREIPVPSVLAPTRVEGLKGERIVSVAAGMAHTVALSEKGEAFVWGSGNGARLGLGDCRSRLSPCRVDALSGPCREVIAGASSTMFLLEPDSGALPAVHACGWGRHGQLGTGDRRNRSLPTPIDGLAGVEVSQVSLGVIHGTALGADGALYGWGFAGCGGLGVDRERLSALGADVTSLLQPTLLSDSAQALVLSAACWRNATGVLFCPHDATDGAERGGFLRPDLLAGVEEPGLAVVPPEGGGAGGTASRAKKRRSYNPDTGDRAFSVKRFRKDLQRRKKLRQERSLRARELAIARKAAAAAAASSSHGPS